MGLNTLFMHETTTVSSDISCDNHGAGSTAVEWSVRSALPSVSVSRSPVLKLTARADANLVTRAVVVDLCSGLGGISLAARQLGMSVAAGVDLTKDALRTFHHNFPEAVSIEGTVTGSKVIDQCSKAIISRRTPGAPLIVVSGPPCQGFSAAGPRDPKDKRNKVFLGVARMIAALDPDCALVENVQTLLAEQHEDRVSHFESHLNSAGYCVLPLKLNAKDYGVAQRRSRAFFLITKTPLDIEKVTSRFLALKQSEISASRALSGLPDALPRALDYDDENESAILPNHFAMRHSERVKEKIAAILPGTGPMSYRKLHPGRPANTLFSGHRAPPAHFLYPRSITVREAARLQGFPDDFRVYGSFANQMMQITNAVPPPLARVVLKVLTEFTGITLPDHV